MDVGYGESVVPAEKLARLRELLHATDGIKGVVVEVGVYRGGSGKVLAENAGTSPVYLFDTFTGIPSHDPGVDGLWKVGDFGSSSLAAVLRVFDPHDNVSVVPGLFPEKSGYVLAGRPVRFAHLDVDNYESYAAALRFLWPLMSPGGIVVFDDYGEACCPGATLAVDEFFIGQTAVVVGTTAYAVKQ